eukprot:jgi/Psemu1/5526/gm1.5526_g
MNQPGMEHNESDLVLEDDEDFNTLFSEQPQWMDDVDGADPNTTRKWRDVVPSSNNARVTIGETQEESWKQAHTEIEDVQAMMQSKLKTKQPSVARCVSLIYNKQGPIFAFFNKELGLNYSFFSRFLATIAFQNAMNLSSTTLYSPNAGRISKKMLMDKSDFDLAWNTIGKLDLPGKGKPTNSLDKLQDAFNHLYCEIFVFKPALLSVTPALKGKLKQSVDNNELSFSKDEDGVDLRDSLERLVIDGFKMYFVASDKEKVGLRIFQHTCANTKGPAIHQVVKTARMTATTNLLKEQFASMVGEDHNHKAVVKVLLRGGAMLNGTKAMTLDNPFV